jgi:hypothetical protein
VKIIPGHGPLGTKEDLRKFITMLKETSAVVDAGIKKAKLWTNSSKKKFWPSGIPEGKPSSRPICLPKSFMTV